MCDSLCVLSHCVLQSSEVPDSLSDDNTWNCSVPHWPRFQRHFRCNLREECVNGRRGPVPLLPLHQWGGQFRGQCFFYLQHRRKVSWSGAQVVCREVGAYLASLTSPREWSDVMSWLHLGTWEPFRRIVFNPKFNRALLVVGLASAAPSLPYM